MDTVRKDYLTTLTILESISDAVFIINNQRKIEYLNRSATDLLDLSFEEVTGRHFSEFLVEPTDIQADESGMRSAELTCAAEVFDQNCGVVEAHLRSQKRLIPVIFNYNNVKGSDGSNAYTIVTLKDFSQRSMSENHWKREQAFSVYQNRLKTIGGLSVGFVHSLSQPLLSLRILHEMMLKKVRKGVPESDALGEKLEKSMQLIEHMDQTIRFVRAFADKTRTRQLNWVDLLDAIHYAESLISYELQENGIELRIDAPENLPVVFTDVMMLEQAFYNLFRNALESFLGSNSTARGEKRIDLVIRMVPEKWVEILVQDNAGGISRHSRAKIFEPFYTTKEESTGVGLTVVKEIFESLGGDIVLLPAVQKGCRFRIRIPLNTGDEKNQLFNLIELHHNR